MALFFYQRLMNAWTALALFASAAAAPAQEAKAPAIAPAPAAQTSTATTATHPAALAAAKPTSASATLSQPTSGTLRMLRTLEAFHKDVKTVHATFHQVRVDEVMMDKVPSEGELWYKKPTLFRADYTDKQPMTTLILEDALYLYVPELKEVDYWKFENAQKRDQQLHQLLIGFGFDVDELIRTYEIQSSEGDAAPLKELKDGGGDPEKTALFYFKPRAEYRDSSPFQSLKLYVDKASHLPEKIWYEDQNQASMTLTMKTIETDKPIDGAMFDKTKVFPAAVEFIDKHKAG